ncbi:MAG: amino acid permease [Actinobacteria bacterium]|nr:amino acid permease [Actinomycetota bacterium]
MAITDTDSRYSPQPLAQGNAELIAETRRYRLKNFLLGKPLVSEDLGHERLSKPVAMGVLASDCLSSSAYGTEQMLTQMVPYIGLAAFSLLVPLTVAIIGVLFFVTLSYLDLIGVYTKSGGSYVVSRDNFGHRIALIAAVALLIDYTVTVAVQTSAGTAALTSAFPAMTPYTVPITVGVVLLLLYGNLRGIREAGTLFAIPAYLFILALSTVIVVGFIKKLSGTLHHLPIPDHHLLVDHQLGHSSNGMLYGLAFIGLLRAFANGGSSLTGLEAIADGVASFRNPTGKNARVVMIWMSSTLAFLVLGTTMLATWTHALPYAAGTPTVVSQEVKAVLGDQGFSHMLFLAVQFCTMLILYTGGNTSFNGFPFLANFVAGDRFLPRQMMKRGHRLAFSNGIVVLASVSLTLVLVFQARVNGLVALYAIGVFTGFLMAGAGMTARHLHLREGRWKWGVVINGFAALLSGSVVIIFAFAKFFEGAWIIVVVGPALYYFLVRLNKQYVAEEAMLEEAEIVETKTKELPDHLVVVLVDEFDVAAIRALKYAHVIAESPGAIRAIHYRIDVRRAHELEEAWVGSSVTAIDLEIFECQDRRIDRAIVEMVTKVTADGRTECTLVLPRRAFTSRLQRVLHDRTADRIAEAVSLIPHVNATIVPFAVSARRSAERRFGNKRPHELAEEPKAPQKLRYADLALAERSVGTVHIEDAQWRSQVKLAGRVSSVKIHSGAAGSRGTVAELSDGTGSITLIFSGRTIAGIQPGTRIVVEGTVGSEGKHKTILNPDFEIVSGPGDEDA